MTTDSFPLRLDTSSGVIKFIETDSDDLIGLAAKCGQYLADTYDSTAKGRWELKAGTGDAGYVGSIIDTRYTISSGNLTSSGQGPLSDTYHIGLVATNNVNQKSPPSGDAIQYPMRYDRTLGGLQEIGDSGGSDPAYTAVQDALISLIFQHDLPGVYRMAPWKAWDENADGILNADGDLIVPNYLSTFSEVQSYYLDSDVWTHVLDINELHADGTTASNKARIYQKTGITAGSATETLINSKRPTGGLRLLKKRTIGSTFLGLATMAGNDETSTNLEMQEFFGGGLLNRIFENQGTGRPGDFEIITSGTPSGGYRNIGQYIDTRQAIIDNGVEGADLGHNGGQPTGGSYAGQVQNNVTLRARGQERSSAQNPVQNRYRSGGVRYNYVTRQTYRYQVQGQQAYAARQPSTVYYSPSLGSNSKLHQRYYLNVKI